MGIAPLTRVQRWVGTAALMICSACGEDAGLHKAEEPVEPIERSARIVEPQAVEALPVEIERAPDTVIEVPPAEVYCEETQTTVEAKPVDLIMIIDNSCSMAEEILSVQDNINSSLAAVIEETGIDYRVIILSLHGEVTTDPDAETRSICVSAPLADGACSPVPAAPTVNDRFHHYSAEIGSRDSWCRMLWTIDGRIPDRHGIYGDGWGASLRPDSVKSFIVMTDDGVSCTETQTGWLQDFDTSSDGHRIAAEFDQSLRTRYPSLFDDDGERAYVWHSVIGMEPPDPLTDAIVTDKSAEATSPGTGHQALSLLTQGLRFPISAPDRFGDLFRQVAEATIETVIDRSCN